MNDIEPGQTCEFDLFRPEDAEGISQLFRTVYGDNYPIQTFIDPKLLIEENASGRTISSVARTSRGDIIGHNALFSSGPYSGIRESGAGVVHPDYRGGKGIFAGLIVHGQKVGAKKFGIETIYGEPICNHIYSQKATAGLGWITQAIEIDLMPAQAYDKEKSASGRVTALLDFKTLRPKPHPVYLPAVYEEIMRFIYKDLDDDRNFSLSQDELPSLIKTDIKIQAFDFAQVARFAVHDTGADLESAFADQEKAVQEKGVVVFQVWLKLSWPWVGQAVDVLRKRGYFLGGILPRWFDVDGMLMQKIIEEPNWEGIQLYSDRAKKILEIIRKDWERVVGSVLLEE
ncbi:MAG: hypothetical protein FJ130_03045 [Deltaproteobacteria bacterium]|nr:hypothetical protein [Deltaproteobacteria bacterium]